MVSKIKISKLNILFTSLIAVAIIVFFSILHSYNVNAEDSVFPINKDFNVTLLNNDAANFITLDYVDTENNQKELFLDYDATDKVFKIQVDNKLLTVADKVIDASQILYYKTNNTVLISTEESENKHIYLLIIPNSIESLDEATFKNNYFHEIEAKNLSEIITENLKQFSINKIGSNLRIDAIDGNSKIFSTIIENFETFNYDPIKTNLDFNKVNLLVSISTYPNLVTTENKAFVWKSNAIKIFNWEDGSELGTINLSAPTTFESFTILGDYLIAAKKDSTAPTTVQVEYIQLTNIAGASLLEHLGSIETNNTNLEIFKSINNTLLVKYGVVKIAYKYACNFEAPQGNKLIKIDYYGQEAQLEDDTNKLKKPSFTSAINVGEDLFVYIYDDYKRIIQYKINKQNKIYAANIIKQNLEIKNLIAFNIANEQKLLILTKSNKLLLWSSAEQDKEITIIEKTSNNPNETLNPSNIVDSVYFDNKLFFIYSRAEVLELKFIDFSSINNGASIELESINIDLNSSTISTSPSLFMFDITSNNIIHFIDKNDGTVYYFQLCNNDSIFTAEYMHLSIKDTRLKNILDFKVDSLGNIFFLKSNKLFKIERKDYNNFTAQETILSQYNFSNVVSLSISQNGNICLTDTNNHIFAILEEKYLNPIQDENITFESDNYLTPGENKILKLKDKTILFRYPGDYSTAFILTEESDLQALYINSHREYDLVITKQGRFGFIRKDSIISVINELAINDNRFDEVELIHQSIELELKAHLSFIPINFIDNNHKYNAYQNSSKFLENLYNQSIKNWVEGFKLNKWENFTPAKYEISSVFTSDVFWQTSENHKPLIVRVRISSSSGNSIILYGLYDEYTTITSLSTHTGKEAKIQVSSIGKKVKLFSRDDPNSQVLYELNDGNIVLVLTRNYEETDFKFVKVSYKTKNNKEYIGYVYKDNLTTNRITTAQAKTMGIVIFSLLITLLQFSFFRYRRKRFDKNDDI